MLVVGGFGGSKKAAGPLASAELWDPAIGSFQPLAATMAQGRTDHTATLLPDGRVLIVGGDVDHGDGNAAEVWDPATESFSATGSMAVPRSGHSATLLPDGRVLVIGGFTTGGEYATTAELWDPRTGSFIPAGSLAVARFGHVAMLLPDGRVLIAGGQVNCARCGAPTNGLASAEVWDPATESFGPAGSLTGPDATREAYTMTLLPDGRVLTIGGDFVTKRQFAPPIPT